MPTLERVAAGRQCGHFRCRGGWDAGAAWSGGTGRRRRRGRL